MNRQSTVAVGSIVAAILKGFDQLTTITANASGSTKDTVISNETAAKKALELIACIENRVPSMP